MTWKRVLLKLSGEALGSEDRSLCPDAIELISRQIKAVVDGGCNVAVVVGGGNILRGRDVSDVISVRAAADQMGMLATMINGLALLDGLERVGLEARLMSAVTAQQVAEVYIRRRAIRHLEKGRVVVLAGGTGNPFFTTDTTAVLRASELECEVMLKATRVDGVYDADPELHPDAKRYERLTCQEVLERQLRVMDLTAITMCMDNHLPIHVFDVFREGNLAKLIAGEPVGTLVTA